VRVPETDPSELSELLAQEEVVQQEDLWITAALRRTGMSIAPDPHVRRGDLHVRTDGNAILYRRVMRHVFDGAASSAK
jgi:hypothetical protein